MPIAAAQRPLRLEADHMLAHLVASRLKILRRIDVADGVTTIQEVLRVAPPLDA